MNPAIHVGDERLRDVNVWQEQQQKRGGQGINRGVGKVRPTLVAGMKIH